ncbi:MAG: hypothetical protein AB1599_03355 [Planctomycetota bacterium]
MAITKSEKFNTTPDLLYNAVQDVAREELRDYYNFVEWDMANKKGSLKYMGAKGEFLVTNASELNINISIGFPVSLKANESDTVKKIEQLYEELRKKFQ